MNKKVEEPNDKDKLISPQIKILKNYIDANFKNVSVFADSFGIRKNHLYSLFNGSRSLATGQMRNIVEKIGYDIFNDKPLDIDLSYIPEYNLQLSAGGGQDAALSNKIQDIPLPNDIIREYRLNIKSLCVLSIKGDSMAPTFIDKEKVLIDTSCDHDYKKYVNKVMAVRFNDLAYIKRISLDHDGRLELTSDNKVNNGNMKVSKADDFQIIGKPVLSLFRKFSQ